MAETTWSYINLGVAIVAEIIGTTALAASNNFSNLRPSLIAIIGYATALWFLSLTLRTMQTGIAYAIWSGVGIVLISTVGWVGFKQRLDPAAIIGIALIVIGVVIVNVFSKSISR